MPKYSSLFLSVGGQLRVSKVCPRDTSFTSSCAVHLTCGVPLSLWELTEHASDEKPRANPLGDNRMRRFGVDGKKMDSANSKYGKYVAGSIKKKRQRETTASSPVLLHHTRPWAGITNKNNDMYFSHREASRCPTGHPKRREAIPRGARCKPDH